MAGGHEHRNAVLRGHVSHARLTAPIHRFRYRMGMLRLDLDALPQTLAPFRLWSMGGRNLGQIRPRDYLNGRAPTLEDWITSLRAALASRLGEPCTGRIELTTQPRSFGTGFNPINLYRCHHADGHLQAVVAEVNNTPWGENILYVLPVAAGCTADIDIEFAKAMHVSPFQPMDMRYRLHWQRDGDQERIALDCWKQDTRVFAARLQLQAEPLSRSGLARLMLHNALLPGRVVGGIYWEALKLWFKRARYFPHPGTAPGASHSSTL
ncbi:MAG: DUF1365 domain-containing protein [Oceanococcaceae bacterium]